MSDSGNRFELHLGGCRETMRAMIADGLKGMRSNVRQIVNAFFDMRARDIRVNPVVSVGVRDRHNFWPQIPCAASMTNRAVDFAGANENGHYDGDMARNNAHWVHFDGSLTKPSWHREGYADAEKACGMVKVGKKAAGRQLDGRTHDEYPEATV